MHALDGSGTGHQSGAREIDVSILPASSILRRAEAELVHELPTGAVIEDDAHSQLERAPVIRVQRVRASGGTAVTDSANLRSKGFV